MNPRDGNGTVLFFILSTLQDVHSVVRGVVNKSNPLESPETFQYARKVSAALKVSTQALPSLGLLSEGCDQSGVRNAAEAFSAICCPRLEARGYSRVNSRV